MTKLLEALSKNAVTLQESALKNFEDEVKKFIDVMNSSCKNLDNASQEQSKLLANVAGTVQNAMTNSARDIQSDFEETRTSLQAIITDSIKQIDNDYQKNMRAMFQTMADNLASIIQELKNANTGGN